MEEKTTDRALRRLAAIGLLVVLVGCLAAVLFPPAYSQIVRGDMVGVPDVPEWLMLVLGGALGALVAVVRGSGGSASAAITPTEYTRMPAPTDDSHMPSPGVLALAATAAAPVAPIAPPPPPAPPAPATSSAQADPTTEPARNGRHPSLINPLAGGITDVAAGPTS